MSRMVRLTSFNNKMTKNDELEQEQFREALYKYAQTYNLKKNKSKSEKAMLDVKKRYVIYARKSTEDEKRQVDSVEDQIEVCMKYAKDHELEIVAEPISEEKSAKIAGKREQFNRMIERLYKGDLYNSILCWHPDRLARNMKESGEILDMLDNDIIVDLQFPSYSFNNDAAGKMTLSILFAMAKEFSDKLSEDTKRGNRKKVRAGKYLGSSKRGYYNNKEGYFRKDEDTYKLYQLAWKEYLEGKTQSEIRKFLENKGEKISENTISNYFQDPFPAGMYCYGDQVIDLSSVDTKFTPIIKPKDFVLAQKMVKDNPRGWKLTDEFRPFRGLVICDNCGNPMTPGLNQSRSKEWYLRLACSNDICKEKRRKAGIKPISDNIRGAKIVDLAIHFYKDLLKVDKRTYDEAKKKYFEERNHIVKDIKEQNKILKFKLSKLESKEKKLSNKFLEDGLSKEISRKISNDLEVVLSQIRSIETQIQKSNQQKNRIRISNGVRFP